jgi:hypothetical protein
MDITYSWEITGIKVKDHGKNKDTIVQINWKKIGRDFDGNTGVFVGSTPVSPVLTDEENFVPFKDITEDNIIEWLQQIVSGSYEEHVNEVIASQLGIGLEEKTFPWVK